MEITSRPNDTFLLELIRSNLRENLSRALKLY